MRGYEDQKLEDSQLLSSLKANREHYNRNIDQLLTSFNEEGSYGDTFKLFGSKYKERIKQFEKLKADNNKLILETRQLQQQLSLFRNSLQDSGWKEEDIVNRLSMQRKPESTFNFVSSEPSARETFKSKQEQIQKMKEDAKKDYEQHFEDYDNLLKEMFKFLELTSNTKDLLKQMKPAPKESSDDQSSSDMVLVPRKRYQLLIELYAATMADKSAEELRKQIQERPEHSEPLEKSEEQQRNHREKYTDIVKGSGFQLTSLQTFFHKLAQKFGYEKEWERYHMENKEQAIVLKGRIDVILRPRLFDSPDKKMEAEEKQLEQKEQVPSVGQKLRRKIDSLIEVIPLSQKQKQCWSEISSKIRNEQLFSAERVIQIYRNVYQETKETQLAQFASIIHTTVSGCISKLESLLLPKYKKGILQREQIESYYKEDQLTSALKAKLAVNLDDKPFLMAKQLSQSVVQKLFNRLSKQLVFASTREIQRTLRRYS